ncbi:hypothetical protein B0J18DRAFT_488814 [Chaetomium sp. MPI-SDFR-AT-0129]|uniref:HD domain-containing protein n=1 Tax=Dichotomopilus funicola TaxID=1934379 RepID=A0AAN6ZNM7_9PEZI|nr:hypothetical protein B0J18DRAFT_488814 [Chaetomium sp. MPI-SDFR-AT-0129]KAK4144324.1 hypothetical protein C8A04DRAFT_11639 [Dichotomopilus funicola]
MASSTPAINAFPNDPLVQAVKEHVKTYMQNYDASHSWDHIERVVTMAHNLYARSDAAFRDSVDLRVVHLAALLHDVGDHKYLQPGENPHTQITTLLLSLSCPSPLATTLQTICSGVSYSTETKNPAHTAALVAQYPELGLVQDADRLDAIGAVGIGRMFTYGGARSTRSLRDTMAHLDEKLVKLEGMMKTEAGRAVARERGERLRVFRGWWVEEAGEI